MVNFCLVDYQGNKIKKIAALFDYDAELLFAIASELDLNCLGQAYFAGNFIFNSLQVKAIKKELMPLQQRIELLNERFIKFFQDIERGFCIEGRYLLWIEGE